jgi:hypothetical protein
VKFDIGYFHELSVKELRIPLKLDENVGHFTVTLTCPYAVGRNACSATIQRTDCCVSMETVVMRTPHNIMLRAAVNVAGASATPCKSYGALGS